MCIRDRTLVNTHERQRNLRRRYTICYMTSRRYFVIAVPPRPSANPECRVLEHQPVGSSPSPGKRTASRACDRRYRRLWSSRSRIPLRERPAPRTRPIAPHSVEETLPITGDGHQPGLAHRPDNEGWPCQGPPAPARTARSALTPSGTRSMPSTRSRWRRAGSRTPCSELQSSQTSPRPRAI